MHTEKSSKKMPQNSGGSMYMFQAEEDKLYGGKINSGNLVIFIYAHTRTCISVP